MTHGTFLALGDSYTIGEGVGPAERWPAQLVVRLRARGVDVADPVVVARTGWTTDELDAGITGAGVQGRFALVSLLIGVNDEFRGRPATAYRAALPALVARAVGFAGGNASHVVMVSIPDWSVTPFAEGRDRARIAAGVAAFNAVARDAAARAGARWADIAPTSVESHADWFAPDGLHPSAAQYATWAKIVEPTAHAALTG